MGCTLEISTVDRLDFRSTAKLAAVSTSDRLAVVTEPSVRIGATDSYVLVPKASSTSIDYNIPQAVVNGIADVAALRNDLLQKLNRLEIAIVAAQQYKNEVIGGVRQQVYNEMKANYLSNADMPAAIQAKILSTDLSTMAISTGPGGTTATLQDISDRYVAVGEAVGGFTEQLEITTNAASSAVSKTEVLTAKAGNMETALETNEFVAAGKFSVWDGVAVPTTGQWKGTAGNYQQYRGNTWVDITNEQHARYLISFNMAGAKSLSTVGDSIVGWQYTNGDAGDNEFKIKADKFYLEAAGASTAAANVPFEVVAGSPNRIKFKGVVSFENTDMNAYSNSNVDLSGLAKTNMSNVTTIDGGKITTGVIKSSASAGPVHKVTEMNLNDGTFVVYDNVGHPRVIIGDLSKVALGG